MTTATVQGKQELHATHVVLNPYNGAWELINADEDFTLDMEALTTLDCYIPGPGLEEYEIKPLPSGKFRIIYDEYQQMYYVETPESQQWTTVW